MMNKQAAQAWMVKAIQRHARHMEGKEPTTGKDGEISQRLMMEEMQYSLKNLNGTFESESLWYKQNVNKI